MDAIKRCLAIFIKMEAEELRNQEGQFGLLIYDKPSMLKQVHGKIKDVDIDDNVAFKTTLGKLLVIKAKDVRSFEAKEMMPEVKEHNNKDVVWDGGILIYKEIGQEVKLKR